MQGCKAGQYPAESIMLLREQMGNKALEDFILEGFFVRVKK